MPTQKLPSEILLIAKASQYIAANKVSEGTVYKGGVLDGDIAIKIYMERVAIQDIFDRDPSNSTLVATANYLYRILYNPYQAEQAIENAGGARPIVSGPANQTISMSGAASFTISVISATPYNISWYKNGVLVVGQTGLNYSYAATFANNGDQVQAIVSNTAGTASSVVGVLTVTNTFVAQMWFGDSDQYASILSGVDNLTYQFSTTMTPAAATFDFTISAEAGNNRWQVIRYPTAWGNVNAYFSTNFNTGAIPSSEYYSLATIGSNTFVCSRKDLSFDPNFPLVFSRP